MALSLRAALAALSVLVAVPAAAQFTLPVPKVLPDSMVLAEDIQTRFAVNRGNADSLRAWLQSVTDTATYGAVVRDFCARENYPMATCIAAVARPQVTARLARDPEMNIVSNETIMTAWIPVLWTSRSEIASYLRRSDLDDGFNIASQFGANIGEKEAYVTSNVVRGVVGRSIFSFDYAAVVAKADTGTIPQREALESDKANLLRAINNGGTVVAHFTAPMYANAGGTAAKAVGLTVGAGFLGPIKETGNSVQRFSATGALEGLTAVSLRSMTGNYASTAQLLFGLRGGYTQSEGSLRLDGGAKGVAFGQLMFGIRQNNSMSFSALVTMTHNQFRDVVPRLVFNYAASR
jgi:hypothetical protein